MGAPFKVAARQRRDGRPVVVAGVSRSLEPVPLTGKDGRLREAWLQQLLFAHPELLPVHELEPGFGDLVAVCRELPTIHGPIDNLFMTADGDIVIVEAKLWRNPQARREVISQALDYASCLFEMSFEQFEAAALRGSFETSVRPASLYAVFSERSDALTQEAFVDAVSTNLTRGRIVIMVVGDGIRAETERLVEALQSHAGFHFTFALVELSLFRMGEGEGVLAVPRTLARTTMIERGIVRIESGLQARISAAEPSSLPGQRVTMTSASAGSISAEQFFEEIAKRDPRAPSALRTLLAELEPLGVYPDFQKSLNLKWDQPDGKPVNLGSIRRNGQIWTEAVNWTLPHAISHRYVEGLAQAWDMDVDRTSFRDNWHVRVNGQAPRIETLMDLLPRWPDLIAMLISEVARQASK